jgi:hypothetical protein
MAAGLATFEKLMSSSDWIRKIEVAFLATAAG